MKLINKLRHVPKPEHLTEHINLKELLELEFYLYQIDSMLFCIAYKGNRSIKPLWHYKFKNETDRSNRILETINDAKKRKEFKQKQKEDKKIKQVELLNNVKKGQVLTRHWGYSMSLNDFYQIIKIDKSSFYAVKIGKDIVSGTIDQGHVKPSPINESSLDKININECKKGTIKNGQLYIEGYVYSVWDGVRDFYENHWD